MQRKQINDDDVTGAAPHAVHGSSRVQPRGAREAGKGKQMSGCENADKGRARGARGAGHPSGTTAARGARWVASFTCLVLPKS